MGSFPGLECAAGSATKKSSETAALKIHIMIYFCEAMSWCSYS